MRRSHGAPKLAPGEVRWKTLFTLSFKENFARVERQLGWLERSQMPFAVAKTLSLDM